jgi:hypothetical protein
VDTPNCRYEGPVRRAVVGFEDELLTDMQLRERSPFSTLTSEETWRWKR